jgi:hypothetical protein
MRRQLCNNVLLVATNCTSGNVEVWLLCAFIYKFDEFHSIKDETTTKKFGHMLAVKIDSKRLVRDFRLSILIIGITSLNVC